MQNIQQEFGIVSFDTALLAKEKGYKKRNGWMGWVDKFYHPKTKTILAYGRIGKCKQSDLIYAPQQHILQKWLREKHKINIVVDVVDSLKGFYYDYYIVLHNVRERDNTQAKIEYDGWAVKKDTYEEALETGIIDALTKINNENN
jgi:hypothetical protein